MNIHKNARTTPRSRAMLVQRVTQEHWPISAVAVAFGISERTVYKWLARYRAEGTAGLHGRLARPALGGSSSTARVARRVAGADPGAAA